METVVNITNSALWVQKDKDANPTYSFDLSSLMPSGAALESAEWVLISGLVVIEATEVSGNSALIRVSGGIENAWSVIRCRWRAVTGNTDDFVLRVFVKQDDEDISPMGSALFPNRFSAVAELRKDNLLAASSGALSSLELSDDYLWSKLLAAESEMQHELRVYFQPTYIIPDDASQAEIDEVVARNIPWAQESAQDYHTRFFSLDSWGYLVMRSKPIVSIESIRFSYPSTNGQLFDVPKEWLRLDKRQGHVNIIPTSVGFALPISGFVLQFLGGSSIPMMIQVRYTAGLTDAARNWPDLVDVVKKQAVLNIIGDSFPASSGSISADGLSQSTSIDMQNYRDVIETKLNGPKGSNGGLRTAIHGITSIVMG